LRREEEQNGSWERSENSWGMPSLYGEHSLMPLILTVCSVSAPSGSHP
jgi:hypothetical protein